MIYLIVLTFNWEAYVIIKLKQLLANSKINASKKFLEIKTEKKDQILKQKSFFTRLNQSYHLKKKYVFFFKHYLHNPHFKDILSLLFLFWTNITVWLTNWQIVNIYLENRWFWKKTFWPLFFFNSVFFFQKKNMFKKKKTEHVFFFFKKTLCDTDK